jgi:hypothetical protein
VAGDTGRTSVVAVGASRNLKRFQISPFVHARTRTLRCCHASSSSRNRFQYQYYQELRRSALRTTCSLYTFTRLTAERGVAEFGPLSSDQVFQHAPRASSTRGCDAAEVLAMAFQLAGGGGGAGRDVRGSWHHDPARPSTRRSKGAGCSLSSEPTSTQRDTLHTRRCEIGFGLVRRRVQAASTIRTNGTAANTRPTS